MTKEITIQQPIYTKDGGIINIEVREKNKEKVQCNNCEYAKLLCGVRICEIMMKNAQDFRRANIQYDFIIGSSDTYINCDFYKEKV